MILSDNAANIKGTDQTAQAVHKRLKTGFEINVNLCLFGLGQIKNTCV